MMMHSNYRHGSPYDRGSADAYYGRPFDPHYFVGHTYASDRVSMDKMTADEIAEYAMGYHQEKDRKDFGNWNDSAEWDDQVEDVREN